MRIAVFGKSGQVAQALARADTAHDLVFIDRESADFTRPDDVAAAAENAATDAIINAVAYTAVDAAEADEATATQVNALSVGALARVAAARGIPLVHISTDYVFDGSGSAPFPPDATTAPLGAYGRSKRAGEEAVVAAGGIYAILRTSWVFSPDGANFVKTMLRLGETRDRLTIVDDQIGGPTSASAIARACLTLAERLAAGAPAGIYHFAGAPDVSWAGFAQEIFRQTGRDVVVEGIPTTDYPTPAARPLNSRLDCGSLVRDYGIARPDWREDLALVLKELS